MPQASCSCRGSYRPWAGGRPFARFILCASIAVTLSFLAGGQAVRPRTLRASLGKDVTFNLHPSGHESTTQNFDAWNKKLGTQERGLKLGAETECGAKEKRSAACQIGRAHV